MQVRHSACLVAAITVLQLGCNDTTVGGSATTASGTDSGGDVLPSTSGIVGSSTSSLTTDGPQQTNTTQDSIPPVLLDVAPFGDTPEVTRGCDRVDFLFVIDNSASMELVQQQVVDNFPVFIEGIQNTLTAVASYQVGIVTTDNYPAAPPECSGLSALVVQTGGTNSSAAVCGPYSEGFNFMTEADDLPSSFACAAQVGTLGDGFEKPMQAVEEAVLRVEGGPGQCNEGFIRDGALLVIVIITDEADGPNDPEGAIPDGASPGTPASWFQTVVDAKGGLADNIVVLSLLNYADGSCPPQKPSFDGQNIADFTTMFGDNGFLGGICERDYGPIFASAIDVIDNACQNFTPTG